MRAQIIEAFGETDVFRLTSLPEPKPGPGVVVLALAATSVNPVDDEVYGRAGGVAGVSGGSYAERIVADARLLLAACASVSGPTEVTSVEGCRIETRREFHHIGPPSKFAPTLVIREVRVCRPAGTGSAEVLASR